MLQNTSKTLGFWAFRKSWSTKLSQIMVYKTPPGGGGGVGVGGGGKPYLARGLYGVHLNKRKTTFLYEFQLNPSHLAGRLIGNNSRPEIAAMIETFTVLILLLQKM